METQNYQIGCPECLAVKCNGCGIYKEIQTLEISFGRLDLKKRIDLVSDLIKEDNSIALKIKRYELENEFMFQK